ncbi:uncharacterized protein F4812DRAFT_436671 [Daldinia caldariorum]|uniref:uncharacterized protein n=1 Tax=Daldinia caldariorum TaxID=326644 RepID=UPI0020086877|nr:uncharacterized protein F4812DRAFT_436671 [Daldinia caldariorum]KAI1465564.1 hypothetical protein F4812DRAFT_436671 [Daldinia caldariorum]
MRYHLAIMSSNSKTRSSNTSDLKRSTSTLPALAKSSPPTSEQKGKQPYMPDPKLGPAIKDLSKLKYRSRPAAKNLSRSSKPIVSQETKDHKFTATTSTPSSPSTKVHASKNSDASKLPSNEVKIKTTGLGNAVTNPKQSPREGRRDPYELISDSEASDNPRDEFRPTSAYKSIPPSVDGRMNKIAAAENIKRSQPSTPTHPSIKPSPDVSSSRETHIPKSPRRSRQYTPTPAPLGKQVILLDSSSDEETSAPITPKARSSSTHRPSVSSSSPARNFSNLAEVPVDRSSQGKVVPARANSSQRRQLSSQRTQARIPAGVEIISIPDSSSESDGQQSGSKSPTCTRLPSQSIEQISPNLATSSMNTVDKKDEGVVSLSTDSSTRSNKRKRDSIVYEGDNPPASTRPQRLISTEVKEHDDLSTRLNRTAPSNRPDGVSRSDESVDAAAQRKSPILAKRASQSKSRSPGQPCPSNVAISESDDSEQDEIQTKSAGLKRIRTPRSIPKNSGTSKAAIKGKNKVVNASLHKKEKDNTIPKPLSQLFSDSDDEYQPTLSDEESSCESSDNKYTLFERSPGRDSSGVVNAVSSPSSPTRRLRSRSYPKPTTSFTPINKPKPRPQREESPSPLPMRSRGGKGHSKSARIVSGVDRSQKRVDKGLVRQHEGGKEENAITQPMEFERKPWWNPQAWIERYETGFMIDFAVPGRLWLGIGPFKGWISDGPGKGTYMPGYEPPDDATIAEAEKTAELRYHLRTYDSDSEDHEQWVKDYFPNTRKPSENECSPPQLTSSVHQDTVSTDSPEHPAIGPQVENSYCTSPSADSEQETPSEHRISSEPKVIERAERVERKEQYVHTGSPSGGINSQITDSHGPISSRTRAKIRTYSSPTKNHIEDTSPLSTASEATSTLIAQQLMVDCSSLPAQVLADPANSNRGNRETNPASSAQLISEQYDADNDHPSTSSSSEPNAGIPAQLHRETSLPRTPERAQSMSIKSEHSSGKQVDAEDKPEWMIPPNALTKSNIEVVLSWMSADQRAEYRSISPIYYCDSCSAQPPTPQHPTSFSEINEATPSSVSVESDGSGEETVKYVLNQSPKWLNNVTEISEPRHTTPDRNMTKISSSTLPIASSPPKSPSLNLRPRQEKRKAVTRDMGSSSSCIEETEKGTACHSTTSAPASESPASKKQKTTENGPGTRKRNTLSQKRRRQRWERRMKEARENNDQA